MTTWLPRGLVFAAGMIVLRLVQGTLINTYPTQAGLISLVLVVIFGLAALAWGFLDGTADARANPDPDRRRDLAMRWLLAGLVAGVISGIVTFLISLVYKNVYAEGLVPEISTIAAFTALLIFLPAMLSVAVGRAIVDRRRPPQARRRVNEDGSEFNVFDAVRDDDRTGPIPPIPAAVAAGAAVDYPEGYPSQVALAEREEREDATEQITAQIHEETERIETEIDDLEAKDRDKNA